jgi:hypothetical protein
MPKSSAIVRGETVEEIARHTMRWTSLGVLAVSFLGAVMAFNGRWPTTWQFWTGAFWENLSLIAVIAGVTLQAFCTLMEWANRRKRFSPQYLGPLAIDVGSTYLGFAPLLVPVFVTGLQRAKLGELISAITAHFAVVLLAWWFAYYPEQNLVEE